MAQLNEGSVSPTTRSPRSESPIHANSNGSAAVRPSGLRTALNAEAPPETSLDLQSTTSNFSASKAHIEAADYMNGGNPHNGITPPSPNRSTIATYPQRQSALKQSIGPPSSYPAEPTSAGTSTPPGRRSVQFARTDPAVDFTGHTRQDSWGNDDGETPSKDRRSQSLMSKLKALASTGGLQTHMRSQSNPTNSVDDTGSAPLTPAADRSSRFPHTLQEEGSDEDADAEETADENGADASRVKRKRRIRRPQATTSGSQTAPNTPRVRNPAADSPGGSRPPFFLYRRATDGSIEQRGHVSEGEGRDRLSAGSAWRRGSSWISSGRALGAGNSGNTGPQTGGVDGTPSARRPSNFRRALTGLGGGQSDGDGQTPKQPRPFLGSERATTFGAQRWRMLKHGLKLLGQKKEEHKVDYLKSAELMAELRAGAPAALMLASMIQRDEHGNKRIPVLLEQLKLRVTDSRPTVEDANETERHLVFRIELEYGSGLNRMKWVIHRSLRDFANLHLRYKIQGSSDKYIQLKSDADSRPKQPRFPKSAFPYFRGVRGLGDSEEDDADAIRVDETVGEATHSETERRGKKKRRPSLGASGRRRSSAVATDPNTGAVVGGTQGAQQKRIYNERQRRRLEQYLQEMIRWLIFRADSNRLCRFLELSALGVRLAAEGSYHGKEGFLIIQSAKGLDVRRMLTPRNVFTRHSPKWFLVRHSYIVCVDSPENMHIYDVYLADSKFEIRKKRRKFSELGGKELVEKAETSAKHPQHHSLKLQNSERKFKLLAKNERQLRQFEESLMFMLSNTPWSKPNRFGSFAPIRTGVYAQWLVDGRDYMWNVSRAINMAKDVIYIHDWWLSPQLYMRFGVYEIFDARSSP
jgi:phospholipase D1/2